MYNSTSANRGNPKIISQSEETNSIHFVEHIVYVDSATTNPVKRAIKSR
jgi:hypothetical protein